MKTYTIKQGNHYSSGLHFRLHSGLEKLEFKTLLHADCLYQLGNNDDLDINKVFGLTWGLFNDNNSFRVGNNCQFNNGKIQYFAYAHENGVRKYFYLFDSVPETEIEWTAIFNRSSNNIFLYQNANPFAGITMPFNFNGVANYGYYNYPYFGGNNVAPHDMTIVIE